MTVHDNQRQPDTSGSFANDLLSEDAQALILSKRPKNVAKSAIALLTARSLEQRFGNPLTAEIDRNGKTQTSDEERREGDTPTTEHIRQVLDDLQKTHPDLFEPEPDVVDPVEAKPTKQPSKESKPLFHAFSWRKEKKSEIADGNEGSEVGSTKENTAFDWKKLSSISQEKLRPINDGARSLYQNTRTNALRAVRASQDKLAQTSSRVRDIHIPRTAILSLVVLVGVATLAALALQNFRAGPSDNEAGVSQSGEVDRDDRSSEPVPDTNPQTARKGTEPPVVDSGSPEKEVTGRADVFTTGLLKIGERELPLFGVEGRKGTEVEEFKKYLGDRSVRCVSVEGSLAYRCSVADRDLSEVVIFNGGGRVSAEATPELVAAEEHARAGRLGLWKSQ